MLAVRFHPVGVPILAPLHRVAASMQFVHQFHRIGIPRADQAQTLAHEFCKRTHVSTLRREGVLFERAPTP